MEMDDDAFLRDLDTACKSVSSNPDGIDNPLLDTRLAKERRLVCHACGLDLALAPWAELAPWVTETKDCGLSTIRVRVHYSCRKAAESLQMSFPFGKGALKKYLEKLPQPVFDTP